MFRQVVENAQQQETKYSSLASTSIENYFPEVHESEVPVACTIGSSLISDLFTGRRILIDLDDLRSESDLIQRFGISGRFLEQLVDNNRVILATNLDPGRLVDYKWMHHFLADKRTIFKIHRTPRFFRSVCSDIETVQEDLRKFISKRFDKLSESEYKGVVARMDNMSIHGPRTGAANKLAWDVARVNAMLQVAAGRTMIRHPSELFDSLFQQVELVYRNKMLVVSPFSGSLGATMLVPFEYMKKVFPDTSRADLVDMDHVVLPELVDYLARVRHQLEFNNTNNPSYWETIDEREEKKLLEVLVNTSETKAAADAENTLRLRFARNDVSLEFGEIATLVEKDMARVQMVKQAFDYGWAFFSGFFLTGKGESFQWAGGGH